MKKIKTFNEYDEFMKSFGYSNKIQPIVFPVIGLTEEAGECSGKVKKWLRGDGKLDKLALIKEIGDVLYYATRLSHDLGYSLEEVANIHIEKLNDRKKRGTLRGNGDNR